MNFVLNARILEVLCDGATISNFGIILLLTIYSYNCDYNYCMYTSMNAPNFIQIGEDRSSFHLYINRPLHILEVRCIF